ncbi:MAG TPA: AAA family ATPase [Candidatus Avipropionibacterium avicola]|uniref:AAA family ATPase n=1 Tax=Candidatus Avipropionibacterium avicola TaxID=2840701 RepID=A0A9D1GX62_9ACTN|nr:AAA family ATPase [Candidatus Avipropionibacterium avicola]
MTTEQAATGPTADQDSAEAGELDNQAAAKLLREAIEQVQRVIVGQEHMVEQLMVGLLAKGHILLEGVPGVAKTLAVRSFATVVGGDFSRVQFTPDLVPSDIVGTRIYSAQQEKFETELGPVFVNFVLADEINRAPAKVQSAMLELMAEKQASIGGVSYPAPKPFIVIATQNPVESEGVYPLPEAQRDRFLLKVDVPYPRGNEEFEILRRMSVNPPEPTPVLNPDLVLQLQAKASDVFVHNLLAEYIVRLVMATRSPAEFDLPDLEPVIQIGCSPRATLGLVAAARALALINGRDYVLPTDVQAVAKDVMAHRLVLGFDAVADNISPTHVVERIVAMVPPPTPVWKDARASQGQSAQPQFQSSAPQSAPQSAPPSAPQSAPQPQQGGFPQPGQFPNPGQQPQQPQHGQQGPYGQPGQFPPPGQGQQPRRPDFG